ncbi:diguanylate cyclase [Massilia sp. Root133]|uniref:hybrid sensor histidine kinase/response regulator n=1 Tax=unclassified Massilia TaxID=2609279 RepID=UPI0006FEC4F3|nr:MULTISPECIES: ATP-binding protein [unclassified Massilia]KQY00771.1 diguanylate cyclase [Massilia sp. Root133]KQZ53197.1 diguanylate cyclase [Massilia sp. Root1485]
MTSTSRVGGRMQGRVLFLCDRPVSDPAIGTVAAEMGYDLVRAHTLDEALAHARHGDDLPGFALVLAGYSGNVDALFDSVRRLRAALPEAPVIAHGVPGSPPFTLESLYDAGALAVLHDPVSIPILKAKARFFLEAYATAAERRGAETALQDTRARLEAIIAAAEVAVWSLDIATGRVRGDARMIEMFGLRPADGPGADVAMYFAAIHPDDVPPTQVLLGRAMETGTPYDATFRVRTPDGAWRWVLARGHPDRHAGTRGMMRGVVIDASLQKEAEERLQASEERYRTLFEAIDEGVCVIEMLYDDAGIPSDYRFIEVNPAFVKATGLAHAVGRTMRSLVPQHEAHWFETYGRVAATGEPVHFVDEAAHLGRWYDVYAARVGPAGSRKVVVLSTDITERRRTELELRRLADDLAEQDRRKTEFLATLAHELRNPLAPIRSGLQLMRRARADPAAIARVQDIMDRQLDHLVHLVDDLLDVARITRGQVDLKPALVPLADVLNAAVETSLPLIEAARHQLDVRLPDEPLMLHADATRITQVVSNLLNNAAKYTPRGGHIVLAVECDGEQALIAVSDNGIGIPPDALGEVFRMFTQIPNATRHMPGGLGIGLSLVKSLVELHGGTIQAASAGTGTGSVFTVRLPLADHGADKAAPGAPGLDASRIPALRLLVVDDNRDAADTLAALLSVMGHDVVVAHDGHQALRMLGGLEPHAVFLDIGMPGLSGYEVAQAVRREPRHDGVMLVALTGWGGADDRARSAQAGFDAHLTKPATVTAIESVLRDVESRRATPQNAPSPADR